MALFHHEGLSENEVYFSRTKYGDNSLPYKESETFISKLFENFKDPLIKILLVALSISLVLSFMGYSEWVESLGIAFAVAIATLVSTYSEYRNEESFQKLQQESSKHLCKVFRYARIVILIYFAIN